MHKGWRMFSQKLRSIAHLPGLFKTLSIIQIYSRHWANIWIYSNVYFVMKTNKNIYSSTKIFEYLNIQIFVLIPVLNRNNVRQITIFANRNNIHELKMWQKGIGIYLWPKYQQRDLWLIYSQTIRELFANRRLFAKHWLKTYLFMYSYFRDLLLFLYMN